MDKGKQGAVMKVKELLYWLGKLNPEHEVMCCGDGCDLYSNIIITDKSCIGEVWMMGADDKVMQNIDSQLGEKYKESPNTSRGVWHYLPDTPDTSCYCMIRMKDRDFVKDATYIKDEDSSKFIITYYDTGLQKYDTRTLRDDEIECWCGLEELADLLDGKR